MTESEPASRDNLLKWHVLLASWLGEIFDGMDSSIYVLALVPALSDLLHTTSHRDIGLAGSVVLFCFMLGWAAGALFFGILSDYLGRTRTMMYTVLIYALATGLCGLAQDWWQLAFFRFITGIGIGGEISVGGVIISEYWRGRPRMYATAFLCSCFGIGYLIAALLNLGLGHIGWRWLYAAGVAPALLSVYIRSRLKEPEQFKEASELRRSLRGKPAQSLSPRERVISKFTFWQLFAEENRYKVLVVVALSSTVIIGYWAVLAWIPAWVNQLVGGLAVGERSQTAIVMNVGAIIASLLSGPLVLALGKRQAFRLSFAGALFCCLGLFLTVKSYGAALLSWVFFVGGFSSMPFVFLFVYTPELFNAGLRGTGFGFSIQIARIFAGLAALAGGQIIQAFNGSYAAAGASISLFYVVGLLATFFMPRTSGEVELGIEIAPARGQARQRSAAASKS